MNEEQIREIAKETFAENIMNNLDSSIVFKYIQELEQENQKYKEVINRAIDYIEENKQHEYRNGNLNEYYLELNEKEMTELLNILKEVEHE